MADIRLVALDLDGTLLNPQNRVSDEDAAAVREAVARGVQVVLATSRWHSAARRTALALEVDGPIISHNGALVRWRDDKWELLHHTLDIELSRAIAGHLDALPDDAYVTVRDVTYLKTQRRRENPPPVTDMAFVEALQKRITDAPTAFLIFGRNAVATTVERFREHHGTELNLAEGFSDTFPNYLNVVHALADKGSALLAVCEALGVAPAEAMAIGDAAPDIAMLRVAGVGVAMGNSAAVVKEAADALAPGNDEAGVAWAIRKFL